MKALVHTAPFEFALQDLPVPSPGPDDVLIQVRAAGICGSDVHGMTGKTGRRIPPIIMGHEAAGDVVSAGPGANEAWIDKRVTFDSTIYCNRCDYCREGRVNLCDNRMVLGVSCDEYRRDGAFAEYIAVPQHILYELPAGVSYNHGAMIEPLSVAMHAVRGSSLQPTDTVLVVGCGIIGLLTIQSARATGCARIIATDLSAHRREAALRCGADLSLHPSELDSGSEVHVAFDAVGTASSAKAVIDHVRKGGTVVLVGNLAAEVPFPLQAVVTREISVLGSCASAGEYSECLQMIQSGAVDLNPLISAVVPLEEAPAMFTRIFNDPDSHLKVIVKPGGDDV